MERTHIDYKDRCIAVKLRQLKEKKFNYHTIANLKNTQLDKDIYIIGAGKSMDYVAPTFFNNKFTIGVNSVYKKFRCDYLVLIHNTIFQECLDDNQRVIASKLDCGCGQDLNLAHTNKEYYVFNTRKNQGANLSTSSLDTEDELVVGASVMQSAIHFAYFLGAANIILCGHDSGLVDGESYYEGYYNNKNSLEKANAGIDRGFFDLCEEQTSLLINKIRDKGVNVVSINPFVNLGLEGHEYKRSHRIKNNNNKEIMV